MDSCKPTGRAPRRRGFTLIEMLVVMGIIIVVLGFLAPTLSKFQQGRSLRSAGTLVTSALNEARNDAVTQKRSLTVIFLQRGVRLYNDEEQKFIGGLRGYAKGKERIRYQLRFTELPYEELPKQAFSDEEGLDPDDIMLKFLADGTVDFRRFSDVPSFKYQKVPAEDADIIVEQIGNPSFKGFIDIRPAGHIAFKVDRFEDLEE